MSLLLKKIPKKQCYNSRHSSNNGDESFEGLIGACFGLHRVGLGSNIVHIITTTFKNDIYNRFSLLLWHAGKHQAFNCGVCVKKTWHICSHKSINSLKSIVHGICCAVKSISVAASIVLSVNPSLAMAIPTLSPEISSIINYQGVELPEKAYADGNMAEAARGKADNETGKLVGTSFTRGAEYKISHKDSFLDKAKHVQANPESYVDWLSGKYEDCAQEGGEPILSKEKVTCDEYQELSEQSCHVGRLLEVDAKHNYECLRKRDKFAKVCARTLGVAIEEKEDCDSGTITWVSGGSMRSAYPYIHVSPIYATMNGLLAKGYVDAHVSLIFFQVGDISSLKELTLESLNNDAAMEITVNGIVAFTNLSTGKSVGEENKDILHFGRQPQAPTINPNGKLPVDILKYIKPGLNGIVFKSLNPKPVTATFRTKQSCKIEVDRWSEVCRQEGL